MNKEGFEISKKNSKKMLTKNIKTASKRNSITTGDKMKSKRNSITNKLEENKIHEIEAALKIKNKVDVELINRIDPSLIGGIKVVIDNHIYDYSIQNELMSMKSQLKV